MTDRLYYMDAMRSILMLLGIVLHAASIYKVGEIWLIRDAQTWAGFDVLANFIHQFRMPAFFIIAGFFCHAMLLRHGTAGFLKARLLRVALPLVTCGLTLNTFQILLLHGPETTLVMLAEPAYWYDGGWVFHLWFLNCLILYFLVAALLYAYAGPAIGRLYHRCSPGARWTRGGLYLLLLPLLTYGTDFIRWHLSAPKAIDFLLASLPWHYSTYFAFGFFLGANKAFREDFCKLRPWLIVSVPVAYVLAFHLLSDQDGLLGKVAQRYMQAFVPWGLCVVCFFLFRTFMNQSTKTLRFLSDASYSVYLIHQPLVILFGLMLMNMTLHPLFKFAFVAGMTLAASLVIHHCLILRIPALRLLFNGKAGQAASRTRTRQVRLPELVVVDNPILPGQRRAL